MTSAESVGFDLLALGALVQLALRWPVLPQRKQIGAARVFPAGRSGLPHDGRGGGGGLALGLVLALGRGGPLGRLPLPLPLDFPLPPSSFFALPKRGCGPPSAGTTTG